MTSLTRTKSLTIFLVVCYALAVTASSLFHNHGGQKRCCPAIPQGACCEGVSCGAQPASGCDGHHHHPPQPVQGEQKEGEESAGEPHFTGQTHSHSGPCPICSFLAQKTVTSEAPLEVIWTSLDKAYDPELPLVPDLLSPYSWHGRAPPVAV